MKFICGFVLLFMNVAALADTAGQVDVSEPFARSTTQHQKNSAVFMTLKNSGADSAIVAASSPVAEVVELHTHRMENGVMRMRRIEQIDLPAGETVLLEPGGLHVMLIGLQQALQVDTEISVTLEYADGSERDLVVPVVHVMRSHGHGSDHGMNHDQGHGMEHDGSHGEKGGHGKQKKHGDCHGKQHGKGHGEDYEHAKHSKHGGCQGKHGEGHGENYQHGKHKKHGNCHGKHKGEGHGKGHGQGHDGDYEHGKGHGADYQHGECHGEDHAKGGMNQQ